jgi:hypothetical protein
LKECWFIATQSKKSQTYAVASHISGKLPDIRGCYLDFLYEGYCAFALLLMQRFILKIGAYSHLATQRRIMMTQITLHDWNSK